MEEMRFEVILRMLIRLGLAEWFVANNVTIMKAIFTSVGNLVGLLSEGSSTELVIDETQAEVIAGLGFGESLIMLILAALLSMIIIICGFFLIYTVYFRFLKLLIIVPLGSIAFSTMGGNRMVSHTAVAYSKYFLSVVLEAVTMALAIILCNTFINAGLPSFTGDYADWAKTLIYLCEMTFMQMMKKKLHFAFGNKPVTYSSTEGEVEVEAIRQAEAAEEKKKRKKKQNTGNKEDFETAKKGMVKTLIFLLFAVFAMAGVIVWYKYFR